MSVLFIKMKTNLLVQINLLAGITFKYIDHSLLLRNQLLFRFRMKIKIRKNIGAGKFEGNKTLRKYW